MLHQVKFVITEKAVGLIPLALWKEITIFIRQTLGEPNEKSSLWNEYQWNKYFYMDGKSIGTANLSDYLKEEKFE